MPRLIDNRIAEQSARICHKFDNARGSDYAQVGSMELNAEETMEEELVGTGYMFQLPFPCMFLQQSWALVALFLFHSSE